MTFQRSFQGQEGSGKGVKIAQNIIREGPQTPHTKPREPKKEKAPGEGNTTKQWERSKDCSRKDWHWDVENVRDGLKQVTQEKSPYPQELIWRGDRRKGGGTVAQEGGGGMETSFGKTGKDIKKESGVESSQKEKGGETCRVGLGSSQFNGKSWWVDGAVERGGDLQRKNDHIAGGEWLGKQTVGFLGRNPQEKVHQEIKKSVVKEKRLKAPVPEERGVKVFAGGLDVGGWHGGMDKSLRNFGKGGKGNIGREGVKNSWRGRQTSDESDVRKEKTRRGWKREIPKERLGRGRVNTGLRYQETSRCDEEVDNSEQSGIGQLTQERRPAEDFEATFGRIVKLGEIIARSSSDRVKLERKANYLVKVLEDLQMEAEEEENCVRMTPRTANFGSTDIRLKKKNMHVQVQAAPESFGCSTARNRSETDLSSTNPETKSGRSSSSG